MLPTQEDLRSLYNDYMVPTYNFAAPIMVRGEGAYVWDITGKRYLDFTMGISVCNLGHCHPKITAALTQQCQQLMHCSNVFCNANAPRLAKLISQGSFGGKVFFANSGAEANEGMIKAARLWGNANGGRNEIICFGHSFHGRTLATLAATAQPIFREGMGPDMPGFKVAVFNDLASVEAAITDKTCAIIVEPVQGEGGLYPATMPFLVGLRKLCDARNLLLLLDEVQCGIARTGTLFAYQHYGIEPDALSMAKAIGNGIPLSAFQLKPHLAELFKTGITHGSTFGGNPLSTAAGIAVMETIQEENVLEHVNKIAKYLHDKLAALHAKHSCVKDVRGLGLMLGVEVGDCLQDVMKNCREDGLLVLSAGKGVIRLLPSLLLTTEQVDEAVAILDKNLP